jgi:hypothetical protein
MLDVVGAIGYGMYADGRHQSSSIVCGMASGENGNCCGYDVYNNPNSCDYATFEPGQPSSSFLFKSANYNQVSTQTIDNRYYGFKSIAAGGDVGPGAVDGCVCTSISASLGSYSSTYGAYANIGNGFAIGIRYDGTMWSWGANGTGFLGINSTEPKNSPTQIGSGTTWQKVRAGGEHALALKTDGTLWAWGDNYTGQLGDNSTINRSSPVQISANGSNTWIDISAGYRHNIGLQSNGTVWAWGENAFGQLGDGTTTARSSPVQVGTLTSWSKIFAGLRNSYFINTSSQLWSCGDNSGGLVGDNTSTSRSSPVQIGSSYSWVDLYPGVVSLTATVYGITTGSIVGWGAGPFSLNLIAPSTSPRRYPTGLIDILSKPEMQSGSFAYGITNTVYRIDPAYVSGLYFYSAMPFIYKRGEVVLFNSATTTNSRTIYTGRGYHGATAVTGNATANFILKNANKYHASTRISYISRNCYWRS